MLTARFDVPQLIAGLVGAQDGELDAAPTAVRCGSPIRQQQLGRDTAGGRIRAAWGRPPADLLRPGSAPGRRPARPGRYTRTAPGGVPAHRAGRTTRSRLTVQACRKTCAEAPETSATRGAGTSLGDDLVQRGPPGIA